MELVYRSAALLAFCVCVSAIVGPTKNSTKTSSLKTDSYLEAYSKSRIEAEKAKQGVVIITAKDGEKKFTKDGEKKIANRDDSFSGYDYSPPSYSGSDSSSFSSSGSSFSGPSNNYLPPSSYNPVKFESDITYNAPAHTYGPPANTYGPPSHTYGPPANTHGPSANNYGPPANTYGPPANTYGPPANTYGPPAPYPPAQTYGPPSPAYGPPKPLSPVYGPPIKPSYGIPYSTGIGFLDKLALKLDILTIAKLLLKLLIFKKLVTMLAVVCMLLVIPKLVSFKKDSGSDNNQNDEEDRQFGHRFLELTSAQQLLERAIEVYGRQQPDCGVTCRLRRVLDDIYEFQPYFREHATQ